MTVDFQSTFTDPGATAYDLVAGNVSAPASGSVDPNIPGAYPIQSVPTAPSGNSATNTRLVNVSPLVIHGDLNGDPINNSFQLTFNGGVGHGYRILATTDLTEPLGSWTLLATG